MIIWLASYPKSGNTMLRTMLSSYLFTNDGSFDFSIMKKISQFPDSFVYDKLGVNYKDLNERIKYFKRMVRVGKCNKCLNVSII